jgi:transposase
MSKILKQVAGIDVAQKELVVSFGQIDETIEVKVFTTKTFINTAKGFKDLVVWVKKQANTDITVRYVMEATGVYHEALAYYLSDNGFEVSIIMPNKISNFFRTVEIKTVTDKTASQVIARFGLERNLDKWNKPAKAFTDLKELTRERDQIIAERTLLKNQLHAEKAKAFPNEKSVGRIKKRIKLLSTQEKEIKTEIAQIIKQNKEVSKQVDLISSITGVGLLTATIVLAETNGFDLIRNKKQLVSYAGLDIREKQSGTSVKGKPRISKRGNRHIRKAMHFPALTAIKHDERYKAIFERTVSKHGIKMKSAVAVQRKLLEMIYTIWKTKKPYEKCYLQKSENQQENKAA